MTAVPEVLLGDFTAVQSVATGDQERGGPSGVFVAMMSTQHPSWLRVM
jgi:hypothetical protein